MLSVKGKTKEGCEEHGGLKQMETDIEDDSL